MRKSEFNPSPTPNWVKDTLCEDLADGIRDAGGVPESRQIEEAIIADTQTYEAQKRERKWRPPRKVNGNDPAQEIAKKLGWKLFRGENVITKQQAQEAALNPRQRAIRDRIRLLIMLKPNTKWTEQQFMYPDYARAYVQEFMDYQSRSAEYKYMGDKDAESKLSRFAVDLADKSVAILPDWKKGV